MSPGKHDNRWEEFYDSARYNKILDERTTIMLHLATAMSVGCYP